MHGQLAGHFGAGRGVGRVLRQLGEEPVAVAGAGQIGFGRGVLPQAGRGRAPREERRIPQGGGAERIG
ncbi:hypothetical protein Rhow_004052 [Rhodococcus wratislaviensis]|uniref:Uncharacterized protein n=1 Tax=Rhodococcus wratislaviensis TaxID=44752 RepID=A0A402C9X0_RHOWR|nr:hypothetical protein CA951_15065 [Rhodococcus sp. NCIMB 12038]GCE40409.1 hypothetical protein Rhow_004052 [Rhodococcus wratislaviensis]